MRSLQNVLLVIGSTALGTSLGYFGLILVIASMQRPGGEPSQAGFGQYLGASSADRLWALWPVLA